MSHPPDHIAQTVVVGGRRFTPMILLPDLHAAMDDMAGRLTEDYRGAEPVLACVLNGAAMFHAGLARRVPLPVQLDYLRIESYNGVRSTGQIRLTAEALLDVTGRHVVVVEDIVDTGHTAAALRRYFTERGAHSVRIAAMLYKPSALQTGQPPEYYAFSIPDVFVIGFGLDYNQQGRNLPAIYMLQENEPIS